MELIKSYFPELPQEQIDQLMQYAELLKEWNQKINLISRKDEDKIVAHHILHALSIAKLVAFEPEADIIDLGTGGGLPGIPLAIVFPEANFLLVDSIGKKIRAVNAMIKELGLQNVTAKQERVENIKQKFDFVVTRAVARTEKLLQWTRRHYKKESMHDLPNGLLALKGGDLTEELEAIRKDYDIIPLSAFYEEEFYETKVLLYVNV